jgi:hypothetical protein
MGITVTEQKCNPEALFNKLLEWAGLLNGVRGELMELVRVAAQELDAANSEAVKACANLETLRAHIKGVKKCTPMMSQLFTAQLDAAEQAAEAYLAEKRRGLNEVVAEVTALHSRLQEVVAAEAQQNKPTADVLAEQLSRSLRGVSPKVYQPSGALPPFSTGNSQQWTVVTHRPPAGQELDRLRGFGVHVKDPETRTRFGAHLTQDQASALSVLTWVKTVEPVHARFPFA